MTSLYRSGSYFAFLALAGIFVVQATFVAVLAMNVVAFFILFLFLICSAFLTQANIILFFSLLFFKNVAILIAINLLDVSDIDRAGFALLLGADVVIASVIAASNFLSSGRWRVPISVLCMVGLVLLYGMYGMAVHGFLPSLSYMRAFLLIPMMYFLACRAPKALEDDWRGIWHILLLYSAFIICEVFIPSFYSLLNVGLFTAVKFDGAAVSTEEFLQSMGTRIAGFYIPRLLGPQLHPISVGYTLASMLLFAMVFIRQKSIVFFASVFILTCAFFASKGAFALSVYFLATYRSLSRYPHVFSASILASIYAVLLVLGALMFKTTASDHLLGLIGGFRTAISNPLGVGLGGVGNLSINRSFDTGAESMIGVAFGSLGLGSIVYFGSLISLMSFSKGCNRYVLTVQYFCLLLMANGLLQEEAFSPAAIALPFYLLFSLNRAVENDKRYLFDGTNSRS